MDLTINKDSQRNKTRWTNHPYIFTECYSVRPFPGPAAIVWLLARGIYFWSLAPVLWCLWHAGSPSPAPPGDRCSPYCALEFDQATGGACRTQKYPSNRLKKQNIRIFLQENFNHTCKNIWQLPLNFNKNLHTMLRIKKFKLSIDIFIPFG